MNDACFCPPEGDAAARELRTIPPGHAACPTNGKIGRAVSTQTVKAMLNLPLSALRPVDYRFCSDPDCPTVYYSADGLQTFDESLLREKVYQKHLYDPDVFACYCFRHSRGSIQREIGDQGRSTVLEDINAGIQAGQCACDIRNPQGSCCLGNVRALVNTLTAAA